MCRYAHVVWCSKRKDRKGNIVGDLRTVAIQCGNNFTWCREYTKYPFEWTSKLSCLPPFLMCSFGVAAQELLYIVVENLVVDTVSNHIYQRLTF